MASLFGLGFLKGAATTGLTRLEQRDEADRQARKEKLLAQVRLETAKELAQYEDLLASSKVSKDLSSPDFDSGEFVMRNAKGDEVGRRSLTQAEIDARNQDVSRARLDEENIRSQIKSREADDAYNRERLNLERSQQGLTRERLNLDRKISGLDGSPADGRNESGSYNVGSEIMRANEKIVADVLSDGIPGEEVAKLAAASAANAKARGQGYNEATQYFIEGLRLLRSGVINDGMTRGFDTDAAGSTINERRTQMGLQAWRP